MTHLKGMTWDHPRGYAGLEAATAEYKRLHGTNISWDRRSLQAFADASIEQMAQDYDFIVLDHPHVGLIADTESLLPLPFPKDATEASLGGSLESYVWRNQLWAYPIDAACQVAVKRSDLCHTELPDWETALAGHYDLPMVTPLLPVDAFDMMMTLIAGRGGERLPMSPTAFCSDEKGLLSLRVLKALYKAGPSEAVHWNPIKALEAMSTTDDFAYAPSLFGYVNYARPGFRPHQLDYCDLPSFRGSALKRGILGGAGIGVSAQTHHPEKAVAFAQWVTSEPVQSGVYLENEGQPAHLQSWRRMGKDPRYSGFLHGALHTMENAWTRPRDVWFLGFVDDVCDIFPGFFLKDRDETDFLREINALYQKHLEERV
ncbi:extracellular solute-binding protein [Pacificoceanicola onchidii]|uniref:extracellular solute-binding protein n=1 Tax=Pacificoceanicola onchidii TaxID=2562685 RepID=UPI0010A61CF8|nr:extracellular solute-binding protein [Pacificoceanicola onchidii]